MSSTKPSYEAVASAEPVLEGQLMVQVVAPENLPAGYKFNAVYEEQVFPVEVPAGGLTKGEKIVVPFDPSLVIEGDGVTGQWKDGLFDCCKFGILHPSLLNACCCPLILLGQIMTRLKLDWLGDPSPTEGWQCTFRTMLYITIGYFILNVIFSPGEEYKDTDDFSYKETPESGTYQLITSLFGAFVIFVTFKVRKYIRTRDHIPEERCIGCEDFCCSFWCGCCVASQMARHTANYKSEPANFCTPKGLPPTETVMVV